MRSSAFSSLRCGGVAVSVMLIGVCFQPKSLAQQPSRKDSSGIANCSPIGARLRTQQVDPACELQTLPALSGSRPAPKLNSNPNPYQSHDSNQMNIDSVLALGPGRTIQDARKYFEKAARRGNAAAQVNLAMLYVHGWATPQNYGAALYWLKSAADLGNSRACTNLGILYLKGWGVRQDYAEALRYFRIAADRGDTPAMVDLGFMHDSGLGTSVDRTAAAEWYRSAAEQGDPLAQNNLADLYLRGEGVPQNDADAFTWFEKAAAQGNTGARIKLGFLYANGRATLKDAEAAYAWILAASLAGDERGLNYLPALEAQLTPGQLARAKQRAQELQAIRDLRPSELALLR